MYDADENDWAWGALWRNESLTCAVCSHYWVATFPSEAPALECPSCGYMNAVPPLIDGVSE